MKKLILITLAAFVMTNCTKESIVDSDLNKSGNKIAFSPYSTITRGNPVDNNAEFMAKDNTFGVTAFSNGDLPLPYMGTASAGAPILSNGTAWDYQNTGDARFWPMNGEELSFFAYAPFTDGNRLATLAFTKAGGMTFTDYVVSDEAAKQQDFMYASALKVGKETPAEAVNLTFKHAMTQILFKARVKTDEGLYVDIEKNGISLHNINSKGTFKLSDIGVGIWDEETMMPTSYTAPSAAVIELHGTKESNVKEVFIAGNVLMLLPQEFDAWNSQTHKNPNAEGQTGGYLSLSCKLYYKDGDNIQYLFGNADEFSVINVPFSSLKGTGQIWKMNNKITYTLLIDGTWAGLEPITFKTEVENWDKATGENIEF